MLAVIGTSNKQESPAWPPLAPTLTPALCSLPEVYHVAQGGARVGCAGRQVGQGVAAQGPGLVRLCRQAHRQVGLPGSYRQLHQVGVCCLAGRGRKRREPAGLGASTVGGRASDGGLTVGWWHAEARDKKLWRCVAQCVLPLSSSFPQDRAPPSWAGCPPASCSPAQPGRHERPAAPAGVVAHGRG